MDQADATSSICNVPQLAKNKWVSVCSESCCDELKFDWPQASGEAVQVVSSRSGKKFQSISSLNAIAEESTRAQTTTIRLDLKETYQPVLGWGGAFTDSTAINTYNLNKSLSSRLIESYFGENGLQYNFGRVPIAGSDFSTRKYTYAETSGDFQLENWSLAAEDIDYKIPMIKEASQLCSSRGTELKLIASPWSAPAWMKTSNSLIRGSLIDDDKHYAAYTNYLLKFYRAYREKGIKFWGATIQNEAFSAFLPFYYFNSMTYTPSQMINFVVNHLGPALEAEGMGKDKFKLIVGDDSLGLVEPLSTRVLSDEQTQRYISGLAFHWYTSGNIVSYNRLNTLHDKVKDKIEFMMMSEACTGSMPLSKHVDLGSWDRGEAYALDIIEDMLRHTGAWIDWNMALDQQGGPNWSGNFVDSPIIVDKANNQFFKQPMYYALAHFSRFFKPGSVRIGSRVEAGGGSLSVVAVKIASTGHVVTNILNRSERPVKVNVQLGATYERQRQSIPVEIEGKSINSIILKL